MAKTNKTATVATAAFVTVDGIQVDVDVHNVALDSILADIVEAGRKAYGANIRVAAKLNDMLAFDWYDIDHGEASDNAKALQPHKDALYKAFRAAGHKNPSVPYNRDIRAYGRNLRAGLAPNGKTMADGSPLPNNVSGDGEATGEGANPAKRSDMLFAVEEGVRLYKRMSKSDDAKIVKAMPHLVAWLGAVGVDVRTIK